MVVVIVLAPSCGRSRCPGNAFVKIAILPQPSSLKPAEGPESRDPRTDPKRTPEARQDPKILSSASNNQYTQR